MSGAEDKKPPPQILQQAETLNNEPTIYSPALRFFFDIIIHNSLIHLIGFILTFVLSIVIPIFYREPLGFTVAVISLFITVFLGAIFDINKTSKIRIYENSLIYKIRSWFT